MAPLVTFKRVGQAVAGSSFEERMRGTLPGRHIHEQNVAVTRFGKARRQAGGNGRDTGALRAAGHSDHFRFVG